MTKKLIMLLMAAVVAAAGGCVKAKPGGTPVAAAKGTVDAATGKSCSQCHRSKVKGPFVHQALASNECTPCHQLLPGNHQKNHALYAVKDKSAKLCYECHDSPSNAKSVHPVIEAEGCIACHSPHSSRYAHLLNDEVPDLCFECHDKKLLKDKDTTSATEFRDGKQNLHYLHAGKNRIACLACHDVHASPQLHLIRPKGFNGKEAVTISYASTDKGGSCTPSCHDQTGYARK